MCGISGIFGHGDRATIASMLDTLIHRGPDDGYFVSYPNFALGARRLSIVDVEGGRQPMSNETSTVWAAQNGELYNYPDMYPKIIARGHQLKTRCDTEMLPHLYEDYGADLPKFIDGMFAVAVWDDTQKAGILARDRMGKKPLYYTMHKGALYFASEIKALLKIPGLERKLNLQAVNHYLSLKHVPNPMTIFEGISIVPPAHVLVFRQGGQPEVRPYWTLDFSGNNDLARMPEAELVDQFLQKLRRGIERRLMSDVPIGFFLSGGLDSSLSTAVAAEMSTSRIKTFTLTYSGDSTTEGKEQDRYWASEIARQYQTEHYQETIKFSSFPDSIRDILYHFDEPFAGVVSTYFLSFLIAKHVKVAISGDGADELFGSYLSHRLAFPLANLAAYKQTGDAALIRPFEHQVAYLDSLAEPEVWAWRYKLLVYSDQEKEQLLNPDVSQSLRDASTRDWLCERFLHLTAKDPLNRILEAEFTTIFPDQVLTFVDRLSMAHSLEIRTAYLDTELVEYVASLPDNLKIRNGETKYLLKQAALKYFPPEMVSRKKEGFLLPIAQWLVNDLRDYVRDTLSPRRLAQHGLFNSDYVQDLVEGLSQGQKDYTYANKVLALVIFQEWYELYMVNINA